MKNPFGDSGNFSRPPADLLIRVLPIETGCAEGRRTAKDLRAFCAARGCPPSPPLLMVFKTAERRNNTAERLLQNNPPILTQVCLATLEEVARDPFGAIWFRPADYRDAVTGTPFAVQPHRKQQDYQRQTARELFVEKAVRKIKILSESPKA